MDTEPKHESLYEWLQRRGLPGLPAEPLHETSPNGESVLHHPNGCHHDSDAARGARRAGPEGTPRVCGCLFQDALQGTTETEFLSEMLTLSYVENVFHLAVQQGPYNLGDTFPQLRALVLRHHRWYAEHSYQSRGILNADGRVVACPALKQVGEHLVREWDATMTTDQPDEALLAEETVRYAVRYMMSRVVLRKTVGLPLPIMNALQDIVWQWLSRPVNTTLVDEYFSARGDNLRKHVCDPLLGSHFRMRLLEEIEEDARRMLGRDVMMACHLGGPDTKVFETDEGLRPIIIWNGIRARRGSTGLGEYPQIVCEWFAQQNEERKRSLVKHTSPGGTVVPICENPGLNPQQWETAITLWEDSFAAGKDDPGPYRDQETAILAAANL